MILTRLTTALQIERALENNLTKNTKQGMKKLVPFGWLWKNRENIIFPK